jgi:hypothetical protein
VLGGEQLGDEERVAAGGGVHPQPRTGSPASRVTARADRGQSATRIATGDRSPPSTRCRSDTTGTSSSR